MILSYVPDVSVQLLSFKRERSKTSNIRNYLCHFSRQFISARRHYRSRYFPFFSHRNKYIPVSQSRNLFFHFLFEPNHFLSSMYFDERNQPIFNCFWKKKKKNRKQRDKKKKKKRRNKNCRDTRWPSKQLIETFSATFNLFWRPSFSRSRHGESISRSNELSVLRSIYTTYTLDEHERWRVYRVFRSMWHPLR